MSEPLPYDDEIRKQLNDLPLLDADKAWEDMQRRLEKDDNNRPVIPPVLRGCALFALFFLIAGGAMFVADPFKWRAPKNENNTQHKNKDNPLEQPLTGQHNIPSQREDSSNKTIIITNQPVDTTTTGESRGAHTAITPGNKPNSNGQQPGLNNTTKQQVAINQPIKTKQGASIGKRPGILTTRKKTGSYERTGILSGRKQQLQQAQLPVAGEINSDSNLTGEADSTDKTKEAIVDSIKQSQLVATTINSDSLPAQPGPDTSVTLTKKKTAAEKQPFYFSAGVGEQQLIPVAGQKINPYNSQGRKNSLGDYIPSIYFRLHKSNQWFIQSGFRYGAPQYNREVIFAQQKRTDSFNIPITLNSSLKKTFYHQLPVSFNYFVLPGLSVGAGISINKFASAIVQQDLYQGITGTPNDTLLSSVIEKTRSTDTNFVNVYLQGLVEAQYQWRRFSGGLRYSFGLQPYLKFQLGGSPPQKESNHSLQLFIQYELWKSRKAGKK